MNVTGPAFASLARKHHVEPEQVVAVHDEIDLVIGALRVKFGGSTAGHGLRSVERALHTPDFFRVRLGVGRPTGRKEPGDWVLENFAKREEPEVGILVADGADATCPDGGWPAGDPGPLQPRRAKGSGRLEGIERQKAPSRRTRPLRAVRRCGEEVWWSRLLDTLIGSEAFERLLLERARPVVARSDAGEDFLVSALARALESPVLVVAPGPREAEQLAGGRGGVARSRTRRAPAGVGRRCRTRGSARRPRSRHAGRTPSGGCARPTGPFVLVAPALAGDAGPGPDARRGRAGGDREGHRPPTGRARRTPRGPRLRPQRRGRAPRRVRGPRRRPRRLPRDGEAAGAARVLGRRDRVDPRVHAVVAAVDLAGRPRRDPAGPRADPRRGPRGPRARTSAEVPRPVPRRARADRRGPPGQGTESLAPLLFDDMPVPARLLPKGSWVVVSEARRTFDRARQAFDDAEALAEASNWPAPPAVEPLGGARWPSPAPPQWVHRGHGLVAPGVGKRRGQPRRAREAGGRARDARLPRRAFRRADTARSNACASSSRSRARRRSRPCSPEDRLPGGRSRSRLRRTCSARGGTRVRRRHEPANRPRRREIEPGDFAVHRPWRWPLRGDPAPGRRRVRARLHGARVRGRRPAERADRPGRDGGALRRRRGASTSSRLGLERTGRGRRAG